MTTRITTDADLVSLAARGELYTVEGGEALRVSEWRGVDALRGRGYARGTYGRDWVLVAANDAAAAVALGREYDERADLDLAGASDDEVVAIVAETR